MKRLHRPPSPSETIQLIEQIAIFVNEGDSIILARKKVCGNQNSMKTRAVLKHPLYLHVLNAYMDDRKLNRSFYSLGDKIKQKKALG